jgi:hypothetical protein
MFACLLWLRELCSIAQGNIVLRPPPRVRKSSSLIFTGLFAAALFTCQPSLGRGTPLEQTASESGSANRPEFEVASIKAVTQQPGPVTAGVKIYPGGRVVIPFVTLKSLICTAFDLGAWQVEGGNDWIDKTPFDVEARAPSGVGASVSLRHSWFGIDDPNLRLMLQSLLINRFRLKFHTETRTGTIYLLETNGKTSPLHPARTDELFKDYGEGYSEASPQGGEW